MARRPPSPARRRVALLRLVFAVAAVAVVASKVVHIYAHLAALPPGLALYGLSLFAQDAILLLALRIALDAPLSRPLRLAVGSAAAALAAVVLLLAAVGISFFLIAGTELHWRNVGIAADAGSWLMLLTGLATLGLVLAAILALAWLLQDVCQAAAGAVLDVLGWAFSALARRCRPAYRRVPQDGGDGEYGDGAEHSEQAAPSAVLRALVVATLLAFVVTTAVRPDDSSLSFMSWTLPLLPFVDFAHGSSNLAGPGAWDDRRTALSAPVPLPWLPAALPGFEDWDAGAKHYRASKDPLKISNLDDKLLPALRGLRDDVEVRHVMLVMLESTRKDVFPIKKGGIIWDRLAASFGGKLPAEAHDRLATLTPTANLLTGDYDDGFDRAGRPRRGGINANNAYTSSTYTLKSMAGTLCGLTPLVADFNAEQENHIYQPCLPHILKALNALVDDDDDGFTSFKWRSLFMQSVTDSYDRQAAEITALGFGRDDVVTKEYLQSPSAKFGKANLPDINYYGMAEVAVKEYVRDAFASAKRNNERVFLTHLTSTTHHPFKMPDEERYVPLAGDKQLDELSHYVNAVGYVDRWLAQLLELLEEEGVANETLVVLVGDHGLSLAENGGVTPYDNPHVANFHVPLVLSHPALPAVDVDDAVVSLQVLPTVLDLLAATGSLSRRARDAALDLARNYEGQSLLRPLRKAAPAGQGGWQFSVMNPGRATLAVRDARRPAWRLIVPVVADTKWRFTDVGGDPHEKAPVLAFDLQTFLAKVGGSHGAEAARWAGEAEAVARWWLKENRRRWRYSE